MTSWYWPSRLAIAVARHQGLTNDREAPQAATPAHVHITPEVAWAFQQIKKLEQQCTCASPQDECRACSSWWAQMATIRNALKLSPVFWPVLPEPGRDSSPGARALYEELDRALTGT
jgi:hypothetical protein